MSDSGRLMGGCEHTDDPCCFQCIREKLGVRYNSEIEGAIDKLLAKSSVDTPKDISPVESKFSVLSGDRVKIYPGSHAKSILPMYAPDYVLKTVITQLPQEVRYLWDCNINVMISGSSIRSIINGEEVGDIDAYGTEKEFKQLNYNFEVLKTGVYSTDYKIPGFKHKVNFVNKLLCSNIFDVLQVVSDYTISSYVLFRDPISHIILLYIHPNWLYDNQNKILRVVLDPLVKLPISKEREQKLLSRGYKYHYN